MIIFAMGLTFALLQPADANGRPATPDGLQVNWQQSLEEEPIIMKNIIKTETIQNIFIVQIISNKLVTSNTEAFKENMDERILENNNILIDMSRVEYIDSSGLGSLLHCLRKSSAAQGHLKLFGITRPILSLFELIHLNQVFEIHANLDEAIASFHSTDGSKGNKT